MGSCTAFSHQQTVPRGLQLERLYCKAAPTRLPVTTYQEAGARNALGNCDSRHLQNEPLAQPVNLRNEYDVSVAPSVLDRSPAELLGHGHDTSAEGPATSIPPSALHTPCFGAGVEHLSTKTHFLLVPPESPCGLLPAAPAQQHTQDASVSGWHQRLYPSQQQRQREEGDPERHSCDTRAAAHFIPAVAAAACGAQWPPVGAQADNLFTPVPATPAPPCHQSGGAGITLPDASTSQQDKRRNRTPVPLPADPRGADMRLRQRAVSRGAQDAEDDGALLPCFDAASRSGGVASTSDRQQAVGLGGSASALRRESTLGGRHRLTGPRRQELVGAAPESPAGLGPGAAGAPQGSVAFPGKAGTLVSAVSVATGLATASAAGASSVARASMGSSVGSDSQRISINGTDSGTGGDRGVGASRRSRAAVRLAAAGGDAKSRRPRAPNISEHQALRACARLRQAALLPRAPTEADLRLTSRLVCVTHWRDLVSLLADHRERHSRMDPQERMRPFLEQTARLQPNRRRGRRGSGSTALAALADPVAALPLTAQHVAVALLRTWKLLEAVPGPQTPAEGRTLGAAVDWLARLAIRLAPSPGTSLRELSTIMYALVRLRHPLSKGYYLVLMNEARRRFAAGGAGDSHCSRARAAAHRRNSADDVSGHGCRSGSKYGNDGGSTLPYNAHDMAQLLWAVANSGMKGLRSDWAAVYGNALLLVVPELTPQGIGMVLHSFAKLRYVPPPELLAALCSRLVCMMRHYNGGAAGAADMVAAPPAGFTIAAAASSAAGCGHIKAAKLEPLEQRVESHGPGLHDTSAGQQHLRLQQRRQHEPGRGTGERAASATNGRGCSAQLQAGTQAGESSGGNGNSARSSEPAVAVHASGLEGLQMAAQQQQQEQPQNTAAAAAALIEAGDGAETSLTASGVQPPPPAGHGQVPCAAPADVSMSLWALATLRLSPSGICPALLPAVECYSLPLLSTFPEQELSNLIWALARLQYIPGRDWVRQLYDTTSHLLPELRPQALSTLLYGIVQMGLRPEPEWLDAVLPYVRQRIRWFPPQSLALTIHALAVMGCRPSDAWLGSFHAQLNSYQGPLDERVRTKVRQAYRLMDFRPGSVFPVAAAATTMAAAASAPAALRLSSRGQEQQGRARPTQLQHQALERQPRREGPGGPTPMVRGAGVRGATSDVATRWEAGDGGGDEDAAAAGPEGPRRRPGPQLEGRSQREERKGNEEEEDEQAVLWGPGMPRRLREWVAGKVGQGDEEGSSGGAGTGTGAGRDVGAGSGSSGQQQQQVLVRPSRFVF